MLHVKEDRLFGDVLDLLLNGETPACAALALAHFQLGIHSWLLPKGEHFPVKDKLLLKSHRLTTFCNIYSKSKEKHEQHIREVLQHLKNNQFYMKLSKCTYFAILIECLGYMADDEELRSNS